MDEKKAEEESEPMDVDVDQCLADINSSFEEMDIDESESEMLKDRSELMDQKVIEKAKKDDEKEALFHEKKREALEKKKKAAEKKVELAKIETKKLKLRNKNKNKLRAKKTKKEKVQVEVPAYRVPNIEEVPANCKHLVDIDDVVYVVTGDGSCGPNCGAALLFKDEVYGPRLRREMNKFMAKHWSKRYKFITNCSPENPFVRKLKEGKLDLVRFLDFLL